MPTTAPIPSRHPLVRGACILACMTLGLGAQAQEAAPAQLPTLEHRIRVGDTLEQLARRYLGDASLWRQLQVHNHNIDPLRLPPGNVLEIPMNLLRSASASVDYVQGRATISRSGDSSKGVERGQVLQEGDQLQLDPDAFVTVRLADGSSVRVQANSELTLRQLRRRGRAGSLQSVLELQQGGVEVDVPGRRDATRTLDVLTPVAATSVRGTRFEVQASAQGTAAAVERGRVVMGARQHPDTARPLAAGYGMAVRTDGQASAPTRLLPPPPTQDLPRLSEDAQWLNLPLPAVAGAQAYRVQVMADQDGAQVLRTALVQGTNARFAAVPDGQYWVQLRAVDELGIAGRKALAPLRVKAHPVAPLPQAPAPDAVSSAGATELLCTPVADAQAYVLQIAPLTDGQMPASADFQQPALQAQDSRECRLDVAALPPGRYAWRTASVRWVDGVRDQGPYLPPLGLTLATPPKAPGADDLQVQSHHGISTLYWPDAAGQRYHLQALAHAQDDTPALDLWLDRAQWTASGLPAGTWQVRIQVQDASGLLSAFSPARQVQILPLVHDGNGQVVGTGTGLGLELDY